MRGSKWPDDVRTAALTLMKQLHHEYPDASRRLVCQEVLCRMEPAPSLHTLVWWASAYAVFPRSPHLQSVRYIESIDVELVDTDDEDLDEEETTLLTNIPEGSLQEKAFDLRIELRRLAAEAEENEDLEIIRAADNHLLAVEGLLHSLGERASHAPTARQPTSDSA